VSDQKPNSPRRKASIRPVQDMPHRGFPSTDLRAETVRLTLVFDQSLTEAKTNSNYGQENEKKNLS